MRRSPYRMGLSGVAVLAVLAGGLLLGRATHLFGPSAVCHGWVSADDAQDVLGGLGRVSSTDHAPASCEVKLAGWGAGGEDVAFILSPAAESARFPFERDLWGVSGAMTVMVGSRTAGAVDRHGGWVALPDACAGAIGGSGGPGRPVLKASVIKAEADPEALARVLEDAAAGLAEQSGCATRAETALGEPAAPSPPAVTDFDEVCALRGFTLPRMTGDRGKSVRQQTAGSLGSGGWFCDLTFSRPGGPVPFARFAIVQHEALTASFDGTRLTRIQCRGRDTYVALDDAGYWSPEERATAGFPSDAELRDRLVSAAQRALGCT
ncbi:hypothetical protein [Streptomyces sp. CC77]|uniref:hypothetical protein n=1 Tax=Streptomyces sp. CC77 TaxID=1906739 RepID=UPI001113FEDC|nr:hypothetical protein [Streptomyces sp. CC77]